MAEKKLLCAAKHGLALSEFVSPAEFPCVAWDFWRRMDMGVTNNRCELRCRVLELESSGRRDELRLHYLHDGQMRSETLPYRLADNQWHLVALGFSSHHFTLFIDCNQVSRTRILTFLHVLFSHKRICFWCFNCFPRQYRFSQVLNCLETCINVARRLHLTLNAVWVVKLQSQSLQGVNSYANLGFVKAYFQNQTRSKQEHRQNEWVFHNKFMSSSPWLRETVWTCEKYWS